MANRIKGITVEIGGDTTGLDKALSFSEVFAISCCNNCCFCAKSLALDGSSFNSLFTSRS